MPAHDLFKTYRTYHRSGDHFKPERTDLIVEIPLEIVINQQRRILIMLTPQMITELVVGFVFTEGLIGHPSEVLECSISTMSKDHGDEYLEARVTLKSGTVFKKKKQETRVSYSSCGVCGKENFNELEMGLGRVKSRHLFSMKTLRHVSERLTDYQPLYARTGGAHAAILFQADGEALLHCEDMGRHNALDKLIGATLLKGWTRADKIVISSGRASLEMILKVTRAGFPIFVAMSRPTSRAVEAARFYNITLVDFAKGSHRIYTHARRIEGF